MSKLIDIQHELTTAQNNTAMFYRINNRCRMIHEALPHYPIEEILTVLLGRNNIPFEEYKEISEFYNQWFEDITQIGDTNDDK